MENDSNQLFFHVVSDEEQETRLDIFLSSRLVSLSRSRIQALIRSGNAKVNNCLSKPSRRLRVGDKISLLIPPPSNLPLEPEALELNIIHEDNSLVVLNKPASLVVHPARGNAPGSERTCNDCFGPTGQQFDFSRNPTPIEACIFNERRALSGSPVFRYSAMNNRSMNMQTSIKARRELRNKNAPVRW